MLRVPLFVVLAAVGCMHFEEAHAQAGLIYPLAGLDSLPRLSLSAFPCSPDTAEPSRLCAWSRTLLDCRALDLQHPDSLSLYQSTIEAGLEYVSVQWAGGVFFRGIRDENRWLADGMTDSVRIHGSLGFTNREFRSGGYFRYVPASIPLHGAALVSLVYSDPDGAKPSLAPAGIASISLDAGHGRNLSLEASRDVADRRFSFTLFELTSLSSYLSGISLGNTVPFDLRLRFTTDRLSLAGSLPLNPRIRLKARGGYTGWGTNKTDYERDVLTGTLSGYDFSSTILIEKGRVTGSLTGGNGVYAGTFFGYYLREGTDLYTPFFEAARISLQKSFAAAACLLRTGFWTFTLPAVSLTYQKARLPDHTSVDPTPFKAISYGAVRCKGMLETLSVGAEAGVEHESMSRHWSVKAGYRPLFLDGELFTYDTWEKTRDSIAMPISAIHFVSIDASTSFACGDNFLVAPALSWDLPVRVVSRGFMAASGGSPSAKSRSPLRIGLLKAAISVQYRRQPNP